MAGLRPIYLFVILSIGANGLGYGCLFVFIISIGVAGVFFLIIFPILFDGLRGGFVVVFFSFHFFDQVGWIGRWFGAVGCCGGAGPITPLSSGKPLPERIRLLKMWNFLHWYLIAKLDQITID